MTESIDLPLLSTTVDKGLLKERVLEDVGCARTTSLRQTFVLSRVYM